MSDIVKELNDFVEKLMEDGPHKTGLMQYFKKHYREILIMKDSGYTTKQITDFLNEKTAAGKIMELNNPVSVVYFNKAWREFCIKKNISTKPTAAIMQQIENDIFSYRDVISSPKNTVENTQKIPNATQETAVQLADLIKFLLELLRQSTGKTEQKPSGRLQDAANQVADALEEHMETPRKPVAPASPDITSLPKARIASFFGDE